MAPSLLSLLTDLSHEAIECTIVVSAVTIVLALCLTLVCISYGRAFTTIVVDACATIAIALPLSAIVFVLYVAALDHYSISITKITVQYVLGGGTVLFFVFLTLAFILHYMLLWRMQEVNSP